MTKVYCKDCKVFLFDDSVTSKIQNIIFKEKPVEKVEYEDGYRCKPCSVSKRIHR